MPKTRKTGKPLSRPSQKLLPKDKRRSTTKASVPIFPKFISEDDDSLEDSLESLNTNHMTTQKTNEEHPDIRVISPVFFKNNRGRVFEQARDGEAVFVIKRHRELMAIVCGYDAETLAKIVDTDKAEIEADLIEDPMKQKVSVSEILEFVKDRSSERKA